jgi:hypothetical protein
MIKMTSWKTFFEAYKISKIQELPGDPPLNPIKALP